MWNYRVVRSKHTFVDPLNMKERIDYTYAIHEAYYDENGHVGAITVDPVKPFGENIEELRHSWIMMAEALGLPILDCDNIPESGYNRRNGPFISGLDEIDERLEEVKTSETEGISLKTVKQVVEEKYGPFDEEGYGEQVEAKRIEKEMIHSKTFVGTPTLEKLINKTLADYHRHLQRDGDENI